MDAGDNLEITRLNGGNLAVRWYFAIYRYVKGSVEGYQFVLFYHVVPKSSNQGRIKACNQSCENIASGYLRLSIYRTHAFSCDKKLQ